MPKNKWYICPAQKKMFYVLILTCEEFLSELDPLHIVERSNEGFQCSEFRIDSQENQHDKEQTGPQR